MQAMHAEVQSWWNAEVRWYKYRRIDRSESWNSVSDNQTTIWKYLILDYSKNGQTIIALMRHLELFILEMRKTDFSKEILLLIIWLIDRVVVSISIHGCHHIIQSSQNNGFHRSFYIQSKNFPASMTSVLTTTLLEII